MSQFLSLAQLPTNSTAKYLVPPTSFKLPTTSSLVETAAKRFSSEPYLTVTAGSVPATVFFNVIVASAANTAVTATRATNKTAKNFFIII